MHTGLSVGYLYKSFLIWHRSWSWDRLPAHAFSLRCTGPPGNLNFTDFCVYLSKWQNFPKFVFDFLIFKIFELCSLTQHHKISATLPMRPRALVAVFENWKRGVHVRGGTIRGTFSKGNVLRLASYFRSMFLFNIAHLLCRAVSSLNFARRPSSLVIICVAQSVFRRTVVRQTFLWKRRSRFTFKPASSPTAGFLQRTLSSWYCTSQNEKKASNVWLRGLDPFNWQIYESETIQSTVLLANL